MPQYTYTGGEGRYYPTLALTPEPDGVYELACNPADGMWTPPDPEPEPPVEATAQELTPAGAGEAAAPTVDPVDPGQTTAPARTRAAKTKEA